MNAIELSKGVTWYYPYGDPVVTDYNEYGWYKFFFYKGFKFVLN